MKTKKTMKSNTSLASAIKSKKKLLIVAVSTGLIGAYLAIQILASGSPSPIPRTSGMPWPSGVYARQNTDGVTRFANYRSKAVDISYSAAPINGTTTLDNITTATFMYDLHAGYSGWLSVGYCLLGTADSTPDNFARGARGEYDAKWRNAATILKNSGFSDRTILRIDWEYNLSHCGNHEGTDLNTYKSYYRRVAQIFKAANPNVKVDFVASGGNSTWSALNGNPMNAYPGDDVIDYIGMDDYDAYPAVLPATETAWLNHVNRAGGLEYWMSIAKQRNKLMSVPEWGLGNGKTNWPGNDGGDNPYYIEKMFSWFGANHSNLAYEMYFDEPNDYINSSILPPLSSAPRGANVKASAKYAELWKNSGTAISPPPPTTPSPVTGIIVKSLTDNGVRTPNTTVSVTYSLNTTGSLTATNLQIIARDANGANYDFGHLNNFVLTGDQTLSASRTFPVGTYNYRVGYNVNGQWKELSPTNNIVISSSPTNTLNNQAPIVKIGSPTNYSKVSDSVAIVASATSSNVIAKMEIYIDNKLYASNTGSEIRYNWNIKGRKVPSGKHIISIRAHDRAGIVGQNSLTVYK